MFDESDPTPVEFLEGGTIELPRHLRGTDAKSILKSKTTACRAPTNLFELNLFQVSNKSGEGSTRGAHTRNTCDAIISTSLNCVELKGRAQGFDLMNGIMIPNMVNEHEMAPSKLFDLLGKHRNVFDNYGSIKRIEVLR